MNSTFIFCSCCDYDTQQKELKNNGFKKETECLVCKNINRFEFCGECHNFYHIEKGCSCQKEK